MYTCYTQTIKSRVAAVWSLETIILLLGSKNVFRGLHAVILDLGS